MSLLWQVNFSGAGFHCPISQVSVCGKLEVGSYPGKHLSLTVNESLKVSIVTSCGSIAACSVGVGLMQGPMERKKRRKESLILELYISISLTSQAFPLHHCVKYQLTIYNSTKWGWGLKFWLNTEIWYTWYTVSSWQVRQHHIMNII